MTTEVKNWTELANIPASETHYLDIDPDKFCGWIRSKESGDLDFYLSTHTFYEEARNRYTQALRRHGFDVQLMSWG